MGGKIRLDRLISSQMPDVSRADVKKMCLKKRISVNGCSTGRGWNTKSTFT